MNSRFDDFVCVKCHNPLNGKKCCCGIEYFNDSDIFSYSFELLLEIFPNYKIIKELQYNEYKSYEIQPESSLSLQDRKDVQLFKAFITRNFQDGKILDVGCGPLFHPGYLPHKSELFGIDPICAPFDGTRIVGCAEFMPFPDNYFNTIIIGTSADHFTDLKAAVTECYRILNKPNGKLIIWTSDMNPYYSVAQQNILDKILLKGSYLIPSSHKTNQFFKSIRIPEGAEDFFHVHHFSLGELLAVLNKNKFTIHDLEYHSTCEVFVLAEPTLTES